MSVPVDLKPLTNTIDIKDIYSGISGIAVSKLFTLPSPPGAVVLRLLGKPGQRRNVGLGHLSRFYALQASESTNRSFQCFKEESIASMYHILKYNFG